MWWNVREGRRRRLDPVFMDIEDVVCDEMVNPLIDRELERQGLTVHRPEPSETDREVLELSDRYDAPVVTRDRDFVFLHREEDHPGIIFDSGMHHRPVSEVREAILQVFKVLSREDLQNTVVRLKRFY